MNRFFYSFFILSAFTLGLFLTVHTGVYAQVSTCNPDNLTRVSYGQSGIAVQNLQQCLIDVGYNIPAGATGYYGAQTRSAVQAFYRAQLGLSDWSGDSVGPQGRGILRTTYQERGGKKTTYAHKSATAEAYQYKRAASADELASYISQESDGFSFGAGILVERGMDDVAESFAPTNTTDSSKSTRQSETNVQVAGIDEPDIVKTDGTHIYTSTQSMYFFDDMMVRSVSEDGDFVELGDTKIVEAFPVSELSIASENIDTSGELLLVDDMLLIFSGREITAYDVSNAEEPEKQWTRAYGENTSYLTARLKDDTVYLVTATRLYKNQPCPAVPLIDAGMVLPCRSVWIPGRIEHIDTSYSIMALDPRDGEVDDSVTITGDSNSTVVSMFEDNIYLVERQGISEYELMLAFITTQLDDLYPASVRNELARIEGLDISCESKVREMQKALEEADAEMTENERLRVHTELENRLQRFTREEIRSFDRSLITRIDTETLSIETSASIPGHLLNQFSLDEYNGYLRAAVTVGDRWLMDGETVNDVYVLNQSLSIVGSVEDLGLTERIYSTRFIGDRGYVVTFREIDPFYVLDLSIPTAPKMVGELKIPGYSSYLEAIDEDTVLGVGKEGSNVKVSLFDVSNTALPVERDKYTLSEWWTEVNGNHRAFLRDSRHEVVFIPANQGGYVLSYAGDNLSLKAAVSGYDVRRAVYIDDYLYVIGQKEITVLDENSWEEVATLAL